jgi:hypothetical protein
MRQIRPQQPARQAQTTLPAVAVALVLLTGVTALGLAMADTAIVGADRTPDERRVAAGTADRLVAADGPLGTRSNVVNESRVDTFDSTTLAEVAPATEEYATEVRLGGDTIAASGDPSGGTTIRRLVSFGMARVRLHNESGLRGTFDIELVPYQTTQLRFQAAGTLADDDVEIVYETPRTTKTTVAVTVDV